MKSMNYWIEKLNLQPHPEGGFYRRTYSSKREIVSSEQIEKPRNVGSAIYYLLGSYSKGHFSSWHRLINLDELWHFYYGSDLAIYVIDQKGKLIVHKLGAKSGTFQVHIPATHWQAAAVEQSNKDAYTLLGCTVCPAFDFEDFELGTRESLLVTYPEHKDIIFKLTRE